MREPGRKRCIVAGHHSASACRRSSEPDRSEACGGRLLEGQLRVVAASAAFASAVAAVKNSCD
jgi:hypothetical protein